MTEIYGVVTVVGFLVLVWGFIAFQVGRHTRWKALYNMLWGDS